MECDRRRKEGARLVLAHFSHERVVRRVGSDLGPVAVVGGNELVVRLVEIEAVWILELGGEAADGPDWRIGTASIPFEQRDRVRLLDGDGNFIPFRRERNIPRLMW